MAKSQARRMPAGLPSLVVLFVLMLAVFNVFKESELQPIVLHNDHEGFYGPQCPARQRRNYKPIPRLMAGAVYSLSYLSQLVDYSTNEIVAAVWGDAGHIPISRVEDALFKVHYSDIPPSERRSFMVERAPPYLNTFHEGALRFYQKKFYGWGHSDAVHYPPDDYVERVLQNSQLAKSIVYLPDGSYRVCLEHLDMLNELLLNELPYEIKCIRSSNGSLTLQSIYGEIYTPFTPGFGLAKIGFLSAAFTYLSHVEHPAAHFHFVDIVAALTWNMRKDSSLYRLLKPHVRHSLMINDAVLSQYTLPFASKHPVRSLFNRINPFISLDVADEDYRRLISKLNRDVFGRADFVNNNCSTNTNFCRQMRQFREIVGAFVAEVGPSIPDRDLAKFSLNLGRNNIDLHGGSYTRGKVLDFLTHFIHTVSFVHSIEHFTLWASYYYKEGVQVFPVVLNGDVPLTLGNFRVRIRDAVNSKMSVREVLAPESTAQFENLAQFYVNYLRQEGVRNPHMGAIDYNFDSPPLQAANARFVERLNQHSHRLSRRGELLTPLYMVAQSISW